MQKKCFQIFARLLGLFCLSLVLAPHSASANGLLGHRAVYDLQLGDASDRSGITNVDGRIVYEFRGNVCDGYTVNLRFVSKIIAGDKLRVNDQQTSTYENPQDGTFHFMTKSFVDQVLDSEVRGIASMNEDATIVDLQRPEDVTLQLTPSLFPTDHILEILKKAQEKQTIYQSHVFDGSGGGEQVQLTTTIIGPASLSEEKAQSDASENLGDTELAKQTFWPVSISYFDDENEEDVLPTYRIAFKLFENGVSSDLTFDYGDFTLLGRLSDLELFEKQPSCN